MGFFGQTHNSPTNATLLLIGLVAVYAITSDFFIARDFNTHYHRFRTDSNDMRETYTPMPLSSEPYLQDLREMGGFF